MKKIYTLIALISLLPILSFCNPVDYPTIQQVASNFWTVMTGNDTVIWTNVTPQTDFQEFYILENKDGAGFVIVAADDCVQPILGYSTTSYVRFPLLPSIQSFLEGYEQEIAYCKRFNVPATPEIEQQWNSLIQGTFTPKNTTAVSPLLSTTWDQAPYYNDLCPDSSGIYAVTGCVATATAQVMKYWNWPQTGVGSHSYTDDNFGYQYANFGATTYDWAHMPNALYYNSTTTEVNAVATLMYHIGVAVEMDYGIDGSSAISNSYGYENLACAENALKNYFKYKNTLHSVYKDDVYDWYWINTLTDELNAGRPVLERGSGEGGGHAFVCDGYDYNGMFHINWGWGSWLDGYFAHNALNPSDGEYNNYEFNENVAIIVGIQPIATQCPCNASEQCTVTLLMNDGFGDGWNGASLSLQSVSGYEYGVTSFDNGLSASQQFSVCPETLILQWTPGEYDDECSFTLYGANNNVLLNVTSNPSGNYSIAQPCALPSGYTITVTSSSTTMGSVTGGGNFNEGEEVTISATANSGYRFTGWNDGVTTNPRTITVTGNATYTAYFSNLGDNERHYDNGSVANNIGAGGSLYWSIRFPAGTLSSYSQLSAVRLWDNYSGTYEVQIYQGGTSSPGTLVTSQTYQLTGSENWYNATLNSPVTINHSQPLWIVCYNSGADYPAAGSDYAGNPDGSWVSIDGSSWTSICDYDFYLTWMIRAVLSNGSTPSQQYTINAVSSNSTMGSVTGGGSCYEGEEVLISATANSGYRFTGWNDGVTTNPRTITVTGNATYIAYFSNLGDSERHYDNGDYVDCIGAGGSLYWGIRFPAGTLSSYSQLSAVRLWDAYSGSYQVRIYQGGISSPGTLITSQTYQLTGSENWYNATLNSPVTINHSQPLWIICYNSGTSHPAAGSNYAGNPDGSWVSVDGSSWSSICDYDFYLTWMIRAVLSYGSEPLEQYTITVLSADPNMGTTSGSNIYDYGAHVQIAAIPYASYAFMRWSDGNTSNPRTITVTGDATYIAEFQPVSGVNDHDFSNVEIYSYGDKIVVNGAEGLSVDIFDATGKLIVRSDHNDSNHSVFTVQASGLYVVRTGNGVTKKVTIIR